VGAGAPFMQCVGESMSVLDRAQGGPLGRRPVSNAAWMSFERPISRISAELSMQVVST
jgi:hypothetical protein